MNRKDLIVKWLKKYEICGNDAWWNDEIYYSLTLDQICDIVNYVNQKSSIKKEDEYLRVIEDLCDKLKKSVVMNSSFAKIINIIKTNPETVDRLDDILERFNAVETVEEGNQLYETISNEIKNDKIKV